MSRTPEQIRHHYEVEKSIATRLKAASRNERKRIYETMYDDLFREVPHHPRLTRREDPAAVARYTKRKLQLLKPFFSKSSVVAEFGSGDGNLAVAASAHFKHVYAIDISDQRKSELHQPENMTFVVFDGYSLELPDDSVDVVYSDMLIEHLHPDDTKLHFETALRILRPGGVYVFRAPHRLSGPWDVSRAFDREASCFHLKEWTYSEMTELLNGLGVENFNSYWVAKGIRVRIPVLMYVRIENLLLCFPHPIKRFLARLIAPVMCMNVFKPK